MANVIDNVKSDSREGAKYLYQIDENRHLVGLSLELLEVHADFPQISIQASLKTHLSRSMREDGQVYPIVCWVEAGDDDVPNYYVGDGHKRRTELAEEGVKNTVVIVHTGWTCVADALKFGIGLNTARLVYSDENLMDLIAKSGLSVKEMSKATGKSEKTIERLAKVATRPWLRKIVDDKILAYTVASDLIDACEDDTARFDAFENSLQEVHRNAMDAAERYENRRKRQKVAHKSLVKRCSPKYHVTEKWPTWKVLLKEGVIEQRGNKWYLKLEKITNAPLVVGTEQEWEKSPTIDNFLNKDWAKWTTADFEEILTGWGWMHEVIQVQHQRPLMVQAKEDHPTPPKGQQVAIKSDGQPEKQQPHMAIKGQNKEEKQTEE